MCLDAKEAEERYRMEPVDLLTAEKIFEARWAMTLLAETLDRLRKEDAAEGRSSTFEAIKVFLGSDQYKISSVIPRRSKSTWAHYERNQDTHSPITQAVQGSIARGGRSELCQIRRKSTRKSMPFAER